MSLADTAGFVLALLHRVGAPLAGTLLSTGSTFSVLSLLSASCIAVIFIAAPRRARGRKIHLALIARVLWPRRIVRSASTRADAGFFLLNIFVTGTLIGWGLLSSVAVSHGATQALSMVFGPPGANNMPSWLGGAVQTGLLFLAYEFGYWLDHYLKHRIGFLWEFHRVHHTAETLSPLTVFRVHPVDTLVFVNILTLASGLTGGVASFLTGAPESEVTLFGTNVIMLGFIYTIQHLQHSHVWIAFTGLWGRILASPAHHQIHHSADPAHFGKNLGSFLSVWDWLFDTLHVPQPTREVVGFGVEAGADRPHSITGGLVTPFIRSAQRLYAMRRPGLTPSASDGAAIARRLGQPEPNAPALR